MSFKKNILIIIVMFFLVAGYFQKKQNDKIDEMQEEFKKVEKRHLEIKEDIKEFQEQFEDNESVELNWYWIND